MSQVRNVLQFIVRRMSTTHSTDLKQILTSKIEEKQELIKKFRKDHGNKQIGNITVDMIYGGMRGITGLLCETSLLDPEKGIRFRGYSIPELLQKLPTAPGEKQPLPEGMFWLLLTNNIPTQSQVNWLSEEWAKRSILPDLIVDLLDNLPSSLHPMAQLSCALTALHHCSNFSQAYAKGIPKTQYWEYTYEDAMDLISRITVIAAIIYRNTYNKHGPICLLQSNKDWAYNFTNMLGFESKEMIEMIRMYLMLHCDHEGGNVTAHTTHLVGSALSDCYLAYAAGLNGLAGPLHGLANQEALIWLQKLREKVGNEPKDVDLISYIQSTLESGKVIPGYGHAVLRTTDPRFLSLRDFALEHLSEDPLFKLCSQMFKIIPPILLKTGKVKNPWPNVDAHSGVLLQHYGMKEMQFYTVMFAVSRSIGVLASLVWDRALGLPIERPKSVTTEELIKHLDVQL